VKAAVTSYAAVQGAKSAAYDKGLEASVLAAQKVTESLDPETQELIQEQTRLAKEYAFQEAQSAALKGEELVKLGYDQYRAASQAMGAAVDDAYRALPEEHRTAIEERRRRMEESKEQVKALAFEVSRPVRRQVISNVGQVLKQSSLSDPDMWGWVRRLVVLIIDDFWEDVEVEVERSIEVSLFKDMRRREPETLVSNSWVHSIWLRFRAFTLYHFLPCDKSIFGMLKDPVYLSFLTITLVPFFSLRILFYSLLLLLLAAAPDGVDEYQLISFILSSKGMQFLTGGVLLNAVGAAEYFYAIHFCHLQPACVGRHTPGQGEPPIFAVVDFFGSVLLVWVAFLLLPRSTKHGLLAQRAAQRKSGVGPALAPPDTEGIGSSSSAALGPRRQGGRMLRVLWWDFTCFCLCCVGLFALQVLTDASIGSEDFLANLFWCRVTYSMLSVPFFLFTLPGLRQLLTHAEPTGFSCEGRCVPLIIGLREDLPAAAQPLLGSGARSV